MSTDGSGNNTLNAGVIKSNTGSNTGLSIASDGQVTIAQNNPTITLGSNASMASSGLTVRNITQVPLADDQTLSSSTTLTTVFSPTYTPLFAGSKVQGILTFLGFAYYTGGTDSRKYIVFEYTGSGITDLTTYQTYNLGGYNYSGGTELYYYFNVGGPLLTTSSIATITANVKLQNQLNSSNSRVGISGNNTLERTFMTWVEYK